MLKWKYGNYQFTINPNSHNSKIDVVGDTVRTLNGALISQPSFIQESYDISAVFYQGRNRVIGQSALTNAVGFEWYNNQFYSLNKVNDRIDIYNQSYAFQSSISLSTIANKNYKGFDVQSDGIWVISDGSGSDNLTKINFSGVKLSGPSTPTGTTALPPVGVESMGGYLWVLRPTGKIDKIRPTDMVTVQTIQGEFGLYYSGISSDGEYLIVGNNDDNPKMYHIDPANGKVVNQITFTGMLSPVDVGYDGSKYYVLNGTSQFQSINGNTVELDIYELKKEIANNKFVDLVDDMGVMTRVFANDFNSERRMGFERMYDVSMSIRKVNRG